MSSRALLPPAAFCALFRTSKRLATFLFMDWQAELHAAKDSARQALTIFPARHTLPRNICSLTIVRGQKHGSCLTSHSKKRPLLRTSIGYEPTKPAAEMVTMQTIEAVLHAVAGRSTCFLTQVQFISGRDAQGAHAFIMQGKSQFAPLFDQHVEGGTPL